MQGEREHTPVSEINICGPLQPGQRIGRYECCARLASGGMATIYLARAEGPGGFKKLVALKCIHPHLVEQEGFVEMFLDEARLASRVDHPNVAEVFDFGFADGTYFIAMGYLVGEPASRVRRRMASDPQPQEDLSFVLKMMGDLAAGLHAVHELRDDQGRLMQVVHRDVTPSNVFVTYDGAVKLLDFGIARAVDQLHHTRTGALKGTFSYMSPEQMSHQPIDRRSDLFAWGAIAWELLAHEPLFRRATEVATMRAVLDEPISSLRTRRPDLPAELIALVDACLCRAPSGRPADAHMIATTVAAIASARGLGADALALGAWMRQGFPERYAEHLGRVEDARKMSLSRTGGGTHAVKRAQPSPNRPQIDGEPGTKPLVPAASRPFAKGGRRFALLMAVAIIVTGTLVGTWAWRSPEVDGSPSAREVSAAIRPVLSAGPEAQQGSFGGAGVTTPAEIPAAPPAPSSARETLASRTRGTRHRDERAARRKSSAPDPQPARAPTGEGIVNVATPGGWADVYLGSQRLGRTPTQIRLPAGPQRLVLRPFGGAAIQRRVDVQREQATRLVVPVTPSP